MIKPGVERELVYFFILLALTWRTKQAQTNLGLLLAGDALPLHNAVNALFTNLLYILAGNKMDTKHDSFSRHAGRQPCLPLVGSIVVERPRQAGSTVATGLTPTSSRRASVQNSPRSTLRTVRPGAEAEINGM